MARKTDAEAAFDAIEVALGHRTLSPIERLRRRLANLVYRRPPSRMEAEANVALDTLGRWFRGHNKAEIAKAREALETLAGQMCLSVVADESLWGDEDPPLRLDEGQLDEARARAAIGQIEDCLHHLERALPEGYGVIAERLAHHFRSRP